jgi:hypothetical protein
MESCHWCYNLFLFKPNTYKPANIPTSKHLNLPTLARKLPCGDVKLFPIFTTMKVLLSIVFALFGLTLIAQTDITPQVTAALKKGDANSLAAYFMSSVEIETPDQEGTFTAAEAKAILTKFFAQAQVRDFTVKHQGTSKLDDQFRIGDMTTAKGTYRVTFFMKKVGNSLQIKQLKIEQ